jgi:hypothetical protein
LSTSNSSSPATGPDESKACVLAVGRFVGIINIFYGSSPEVRRNVPSKDSKLVGDIFQ